MLQEAALLTLTITPFSTLIIFISAPFKITQCTYLLTGMSHLLESKFLDMSYSSLNP